MMQAGVRRITYWLLAFAALIVVFGLAAFAVAVGASLIASGAPALIALAIGASQLIHAYYRRQRGDAGRQAASGLLNVAVGALLLSYPTDGVVAIALLLASLVFPIGVIESIVVLVGVLLAVGSPGDALPVIALYIGACAMTACIAAAVLPVTEPRRKRDACVTTLRRRTATLH